MPWGSLRMDDTRKHAAFAAANEAHAHLASARKHLIGQRLPLAGMHRDLEKAAADLCAARAKIEEALQAVAASRHDVPAAVSD